MSSRLSTSTLEKAQARCGLCGRALGKGYYFLCHVCGAAYCYAHMPVKCGHPGTQKRIYTGPE
ncbi:MAG TPA: hypothetical protein VLY21_03035 [Nitrososphaerales archaeon]|nr:hypothetical protein [Nitrososphaerales archaeon]